MHGRRYGHHDVATRPRSCQPLLKTIAVLLCCQLAASKPLHEGRMHSAHHLVKKDAKARRLGGEGDSIPKLLHYIYLPGLQAYKADVSKPDSRLKLEHFEGCQKLHAHWDSLFWDEALGLQFVKEFYPSFLPVYESYDGWGKQAKKSDALRSLIMEHYGGLYLDLDVECYKAADESLKGYQVVLQGSGDEGINNCVMASMPGHPFWAEHTKVLVARAGEGTNPQFDSPMYMSGTLALTRALIDFIPNPGIHRVTGYTNVEYQANGTVRLYAIGDWYIPCYGQDHICVRQLEKELKEGIWDMTNLYGRHYFAESSTPEQIATGLRDHVVPA